MDLENGQSVLTRTQRDILAYWVSLSIDGDLPSRRQVNPARLGTALAHTSLVQRNGDEFRYRLTGSRVKGLFGCNQDKSPLAVIDETIAEAGSASLGLALETRRPVSGSRRVGARWHSWLRLPLLDEAGEPSLVLCVDEFPASLDGALPNRSNLAMVERFVA